MRCVHYDRWRLSDRHVGKREGFYALPDYGVGLLSFPIQPSLPLVPHLAARGLGGKKKR